MKQDAKKRKIPKRHFVLKLGLIFTLILGFVCSFGMQLKYNSLRAERDELRAKRDSIYAEIERKKEELDAPFDYGYVERVARAKLGYCMPGETIYFSNIKPK